MFGSRRIAHALALLLCAALCGCGTRPAVAVPTLPPAPDATKAPVAATAAPPARPTIVAAPTVAVTDTPPAAPTAAPFQPAPVAGKTVLQLSYGAGSGQIGTTAGSNDETPPTFRIGSDGSIRVLDRINQRVLFFSAGGALQRSVAIADAVDARDFIVTSQGDMFVYDANSERPAVLRYDAKGALAERHAVSPNLFADGIMLSAAQEQNRPPEIVLTEGIERYWVVRHFNTYVPPDLQQITEQPGTVSPRSPTPFVTTPGESGPVVEFVALTAGGGSAVQRNTVGETPLPGERFFNVDRAMNLYMVRGLSGEQTDSIDVWRVAPQLDQDGSFTQIFTVGGSARVSLAGCQQPTWRTFYVDQVGAAWSLCATADGVTIASYQLQDARGQPLSEAAADAAKVPWSPGSRLNAA